MDDPSYRRATAGSASRRGSGGERHARLASFRGRSGAEAGSSVASKPRARTRTDRGGTDQRATAPRSGTGRNSGTGRPSSPRRPIGQRPARPQYLKGAPRQARRGGYDSRRRGPLSSLTWNPLLLIPLVLVLVVGFGAFSIVSSCNRQAAEEQAQEEAATEAARIEAQRVHPEKLGMTVASISAPRSAWRQGEMPHLYQTDPAWAYKPYGGGTVRANACGPTALTMVYVYLTGKTDYDPGTMAAFSDSYGYAPTGATEWAFMTEGAWTLGLQSWTISVNRSSIQEALGAGQPVICSVTPGDFTTTGHYIVLKSIDGRGMVEVFDPNSAANSAVRWPIQRILNQTANCWAFAA